MSDRPILFSTPMVQAILGGRKTQTRRAVKPQPVEVVDGIPYRDAHDSVAQVSVGTKVHRSPYGVPGDRLWVRETWRPSGPYADMSIAEIGKYFCDPRTSMKDELYFKADCKPYDGGAADPWLPSIHMPRWASRIMLEITGVRVERLQAISEADVAAEGVESCHDCDAMILTHRDGGEHWNVSDYAHLWDSINGAGSWDANPWVWVVEFKKEK